MHYMNVHSTNFPDGEIRGQLLWNPSLEERFFARQHYLDFLSREPDPGGFDYWSGQVGGCLADVQCLHDRTIGVSNSFFFEQEYQKTGAFTFRLYRAAYGNNQPFPNPDTSNDTERKKYPDYAHFAPDRARVVGGADLTAGQQALANAFAQRPEFLAKYAASLTLDQFVDAILATVKNDLGVDLTSQRNALIALGSRDGVIYRLADDNAANPISNGALINAEYNRAFVYSQYSGYLRRDSDIAGFRFWLGQVSSGPLRDVSKQHQMVCSFITSDEWQLRFGNTVTHHNSECPH